MQLARWGLLDEVVASGAPPIRSLSFHHPGGSIVREIKEPAGVDHLLAPRRHVLDAILLAAADDAGATRADGREPSRAPWPTRSGRVTGVTLRDREGANRAVHARFVIGADGVRSRIARSVGARTIEDRGPTGTTTYAYVAGLDADGFEFHLGDRTFAGVFPTHDGEANVWVCTPADAAVLGTGDRGDAFVDLLAATSPKLAARVRDARITSPLAHRDGPARTTSSRPPDPAGRSSATPATTAIRSRGTGSPTRSATPSCSPGDWGRPCGTRCPRPRRWPATPRTATARWARSSTSPGSWRSTRRSISSSSSRSSSAG